MNYKKFVEQLKEVGLVDDRNLICHSYRSVTSSSNRIVYMKFSTVSNDRRMPSFMLLSIKDDMLHISQAKAFGGYKKYYASFKLSNLKFETEISYGVTKIFAFNVFKDEKRIGNFFIIAIRHMDDVIKLVNAIKDYNIVEKE